MMDEKNSDKIFREKLESFSVPPPPHIWDNVQGQLAALKKRKRLAYISWISAAAVVVLAFMAGWYFNTDPNSNLPLATQNQTIKENPVIPEKRTEPKTVAVANENPAVETENHEQLASAKISNLKSIANAVTNNGVEEKITLNSFTTESIDLAQLAYIKAKVTQKQIAFGLAENKTETVVYSDLSQSEQFLIAQNIKNSDASKESENNWKMGLYVSPGYSSHVASHSDNYNQQMTLSSSSGNANVSGGVSFQYKTTKRLSVESGVYYAKNGQKSENTFQLLSFRQNGDLMFDAAPGSDKSYSSNVVQMDNGNLQMNSTAGVIAFNETPKGAEISGDFESLATGNTNALISNGEFSQVFDFVEIPLYLRYRVVDSKFGIELLGGINAGVVVGNNAYIDNQYGLQNIGETRDISTLNLSGTVGVGLNYAMGKHISLAVEPRLNYYLNSINKNPEVDFRPYRVGFYTGLYYAF